MLFRDAYSGLSCSRGLFVEAVCWSRERQPSLHPLSFP